MARHGEVAIAKQHHLQPQPTPSLPNAHSVFPLRFEPKNQVGAPSTDFTEVKKQKKMKSQTVGFWEVKVEDKVERQGRTVRLVV